MDQLRAFPDNEIDRILGTLTNEERASLLWAWDDFWLRPDVREPGAMVGTGQRTPLGDHIYVVWQGGRGSGKSTPAMLAFADDAHALGPDFVGVVLCENDEEARKLIEDRKSGMKAILPPWKRPHFAPSVEGGLLTFPSGAVAHVISAEKPSKGRSPNFNRLLVDDPPKFGPQAKGLFDALLRAFRLTGHGLRAYIATTPPGDPPPRCPGLLEHLLAAQLDPTKAADWVYSISPSDANMSNLDRDTKRVLATFKGSAAEGPEREGTYDPKGGPRIFAGIDFTVPPVRVSAPADRFLTITIAIDPAESSATHACEVGIVAVGRTADDYGYILEDASGKFNSDQWADVAHDLYDRWEALAAMLRFRVEINRGTKDSTILKLTEIVRRQRKGLAGFAAREIRYVTAREGKGERAIPIPSLYRMGRMRHLTGLHDVEGQLHKLANVPRQTGVDRADAAVYGILDVFDLFDPNDQPRIGGASMPHAERAGPAPLASMVVGPLPHAGPRMVSPAAFQMSAPGSYQR